jgi:hypothetical protein
MPKKEAILDQVSRLCLAMPEAAREIHGSHASFLVRKKTFAYFLDNHHGDGILGINCKALPGDNLALIAADPERFYMPAYIGPRGWVGLRLDKGEIDWDEVSEMLKLSYKLTAPKKLAAMIKISEA